MVAVQDQERGDAEALLCLPGKRRRLLFDSVGAAVTVVGSAASAEDRVTSVARSLVERVAHGGRALTLART